MTTHQPSPTVPDQPPATETIAALLASGRIEGQATVTGLVTRLDQRLNKARNPWAIATVDDTTGTLDIQFFPKTWTTLRHHLLLGEEFTCSGRINEQNGEITLFGSAAVPHRTGEP
jgi:DNA polymerase-3 subunit alpha